MFSNRTLLLLSSLSLFAGMLFYFFSGADIIIFQWLGIEPAGHLSPGVDILNNYFSDLTWVVALCLVLIVLKRSQHVAKESVSFLILLPFATEIGQYLKWLPGTFDSFDMLLYAIVISCFPLSLKFVDMRKLKVMSLPVLTASVFIFMALASGTQKPTYYKPAPCVTHKGLNYSPVLTKINLSGSYTMKDLSGAQRIGYQIIMEELKSLNPGKYQLADGVTPNLTLDITINTDSYQHYGATLNMYVYDGSVYKTWPTNYVTAEKLFSDVCYMINRFVSYGWCTNCPDPCNP